MNAWQRAIYATVYAIATAWFDARRESMRAVEEYPIPDDLRRADAFRSAIVRNQGQPGDPESHNSP